MAIWALVLGAAIIVIVLWDAFETIVATPCQISRMRGSQSSKIAKSHRMPLSIS
jgi:hypothetical protein